MEEGGRESKGGSTSYEGKEEDAEIFLRCPRDI